LCVVPCTCPLAVRVSAIQHTTTHTIASPARAREVLGGPPHAHLTRSRSFHAPFAPSLPRSLSPPFIGAAWAADVRQSAERRKRESPRSPVSPVFPRIPFPCPGHRTLSLCIVCDVRVLNRPFPCPLVDTRPSPPSPPARHGRSLSSSHRFNLRVLATRRRARRSKSKSQHQMGSRPNQHRRRADKADRGGKGGKPHSASSPSSTPPRTDWERSALRFLTRLDATGEGRRRPRSSPGTGGCWAKRVARAVAACSMWEGSRWSTSRSTTSVLLLAEGY
jgi:hypothetical protein